ncbi:MAG: hypothetical protein VX938_08425, partial [Myxococcota bacterium]|nr:hypothetical protein [Myxococcota bacterium]
CDDGDPCTNDSCSPDSGCVSVPKCDDGDACTNNVCNGGGCSYPAKSCVDGNPCTFDKCNSQSGCDFTTATNCTDNNECTNTYCDAAWGGCKSDPPVTCTQPLVCSNGACIQP